MVCRVTVFPYGSLLSDASREWICTAIWPVVLWAQAGILPSKKPSLGVSCRSHRHHPCWEPISSTWVSAGCLNILHAQLHTLQTFPCCFHRRGTKHRLCPHPEVLMRPGPALCNSLHVCSYAWVLASSSWGFRGTPLHSQPHGQRALWGPGELPCSLVPVTAGGEADVLQEVGQTPPLPVEMLVALLSGCGLPALPCHPMLGANSSDPDRSRLGCAVVSCFPLQPALS